MGEIFNLLSQVGGFDDTVIIKPPGEKNIDGAFQAAGQAIFAVLPDTAQEIVSHKGHNDLFSSAGQQTDPAAIAIVSMDNVYRVFPKPLSEPHGIVEITFFPPPLKGETRHLHPNIFQGVHLRSGKRAVGVSAVNKKNFHEDKFKLWPLGGKGYLECFGGFRFAFLTFSAEITQLLTIHTKKASQV